MEVCAEATREKFDRCVNHIQAAALTEEDRKFDLSYLKWESAS